MVKDLDDILEYQNMACTLKNFKITVVHAFLLYLILGPSDIKVFGHEYSHLLLLLIGFAFFAP